MATTNVPNWKTAKDGIPGDLNSTNHSAQVDQLLGLHNSTIIYPGNQIVTPKGGVFLSDFTVSSSSAFDTSQPFTMPVGNTSLSRVSFYVKVIGAGSDLTVSLYPDNGSGSPNTANLLASTHIPASYINSISAPNGLEGVGGGLARASTNTLLGSGGITTKPWGGPIGDSSGISQSPSVTTSGNFLIMAGGFTSGPTVVVSTVSTAQFLGGTSFSTGVAQPSLPQATANGMISTTTGSVIHAGGNGPSSTFSNVWVASWDANKGIIGSWSSQTSLPVTIKQAGTASFQNTVYIIGGDDGNSHVLSSVYVGNVSNGQLGSWGTGTPLPVGLKNPVAAVIGNWLVVCGGSTDIPGNVISSATYYIAINPDGTLSDVWLTGPPMPVGINTFVPGWDTCVLTNELVLVAGGTGGGTFTNAIQILPFDSQGPSEQWTWCTWNQTNVELMAAFPLGNGAWIMLNANIPASQYNYTTLLPRTRISVPLVASGLTPGNTYHMVYQQTPAPAPGDGVFMTVLDASPLPASALRSPRHQNSWSVVASTLAAPVTVWSNSSVSNSPIHTWGDPSSTGSSYTNNIASAISTIQYNKFSLPSGVLEVTSFPNDPLDVNPTFTSGTSPWTATNCTLTQSNAQTHGGFPFSGLITPNGTSATVFVQSENFPVSPGNSITNIGRFYQANGWFYSTSGTTNFSLSINWYDHGSNLISTSSNTVPLTAATWTNVVNYANPPLTAAFAALVPTLGGTPPAANTLFLSNVVLTLANEMTQTLAPVTQVTYSSAPWPPTGLTQLN